MDAPRPRVLIAELTHRCPLRCAYCSNPTSLQTSGELSTAAWLQVLEESAKLGVRQVHFTGGEPLLRADLESLVGCASGLGLYPTIVTSGLGLPKPGGSVASRVEGLAAAGVRAVQVSFQDTEAAAARALAGADAFAQKLEVAQATARAGLSLTTNFVLHAHNLARLTRFVELSLELGADRIELASVQYQGWAALNRAYLVPTREQLERASDEVRRVKLLHSAAIEILYVMPDVRSGRAKPCMGGLGSSAIVVDPQGLALPCHGARAWPLRHESVVEQHLGAIWRSGAAFTAFRGEDWMQAPCSTCELRTVDHGGCRCQAFRFTGDLRATDPACPKSPVHERFVQLGRQGECDTPPRPASPLLRGSNRTLPRFNGGAGAGPPAGPGDPEGRFMARQR